MEPVDISRLMIRLVKSYLLGERFTDTLSKEQSEAVFALAQKHDVAHLVGLALPNSSASEKQNCELFVQAQYKAVFRYERMNYERQKIYQLFEEQEISFLPLKGAVLGSLYPEPWHRTSCDMDILVAEESLSEALMLLEERLQYKNQGKSEHDISLRSPNGIHIELHYDFHEKDISTQAVWDAVTQKKPGSFHCVMPPEMFFYCHIAHMAKHFKYGGCGFRPFVDIWMMNHHMTYDRKKLDAMLIKDGLKKFADIIFKLMDVWFGDAEMDSVLAMASDYIVNAGAYGSVENRVAAGQIKKKSKFRYAMARIFLRYEALKYPYPILERHRWLMPFCQIHRWIKLLGAGKLKQAANEIEINGRMDRDHQNEIRELFDTLGVL